MLTRIKIITIHLTIIIDGIQIPPINNRSRLIGSSFHNTPGNKFVGWLAIRQGNITLCPCFYGKYWRLGTASTTNDNQILKINRGRCGNFRTPSQPPEFFTIFRIISINEIGWICYQFNAFTIFKDCWCSPGRQFIAECFPDCFAGFNIASNKKGFSLRIALNNDHILINNRWSSCSPFIFGSIICPDIKSAQIFFPYSLTIHIKGK